METPKLKKKLNLNAVLLSGFLRSHEFLQRYQRRVISLKSESPHLLFYFVKNCGTQLLRRCDKLETCPTAPTNHELVKGTKMTKPKVQKKG